MPDEKIRLIVNGDDVGMTREYTDAVLDMLFRGLLCSASLYVPGDDAERALGIIRKRPGQSIGIHLALTGAYRPLTGGASLRGEGGLFPATLAEAAPRVNPDEAAAEWEAQIRRVLDAGVAISHLDSHMGCFEGSPRLYRIGSGLARKYRAAFIAPPVPRRKHPSGESWDGLDEPDAGLLGLYVLPGGEEETLENRSAAYWRLFRGLSRGLYYIWTHPSLDGPGADHEGDIALRLNEALFWSDPANRARLAEEGIELAPIPVPAGG